MADEKTPRQNPQFGPRAPIAILQKATNNLGLDGNLYEEYGRTGLRHWGGFLFEEWLAELQQDRRAAEVYREMADQDPIVGGVLYAILSLMRRVRWWTEPGKPAAGRPGRKQSGQRGAEWFESVYRDMRYSWEDTLGSNLSFLTYGYDYEEIVFKKRLGETDDPTTNSEFSDGTIAVGKISTRAQDSNWKWVFDEVGEIVGFIQNPPPDYLLRFIPIQKALHFRTTTFKDSPSGRSILRSAYRPWYFARNLQNIEGIGMERDLAGLPVLTPPEGTDIWDANDPTMVAILGQAQQVVSSIRRDEQEGVILPYGWDLTLLSSGGSRQLDISGAIKRYQMDIATSMLADVMLLGQQATGSYALSVTKKDMFTASLGMFLDIISSVYNTQLIPRLWKLNGFTDPMPKLCHGQVETIDLDTLGTFLRNIGTSGAPIAWETTLPWLNDQAGIPQPPPGHDFTARNVAQPGAPGANGFGPHADTAVVSQKKLTPVTKDEFEDWPLLRAARD